MMLIYSLIISLLVSCSSNVIAPSQEPKTYSPKYAGKPIPPEIKVVVDEFMRLAKKNKISFTDNVSIGFNNINKGSVIGLCSYTKAWREIEIDRYFWDRSSGARKVILVFHELSHCYCGRDHDFADGKQYPDDIWGTVYVGVEKLFSPILGLPEGYFNDGCPTSIMHPYIPENKCIKSHYKHYIKEMFDRCNPY